VSATAPAPVVFIVGAGVVGTALAAGLVRSGMAVTVSRGRATEIAPALSSADVVVIAVRDDRIGEVAGRLVREQRLRREQVLLHTSGAHPSAEVLAAARPHVRGVGTWHPLISFAAPLASGLEGVAFGIEGDEPARAAAGRLSQALGARPVFLDGASMPLYHAGAVIAANYLVALADAARALLVAAGVAPEQALPALIPLMSSVIQNLSQQGLPGALTGPVARGDVSSVEQHLRILAQRAPDMLDLYRRLGRDVLRLAREKSAMEPQTVTRLQALFSDSPDPVKDPPRNPMKKKR
jgi:predicted short-subunit dehydrogenase-like oxidoreductase (DUF2520 family)